MALIYRDVARVPRKRSVKRNHWCFTSYLDKLPESYDAKIVRYIVYQREICPESKREHWQGYIEFYDQKRIGELKKLMGELHGEARKGSRTAAREYCMKKDTAIFNTIFEFGTWREEANRKRKLSDILLSNISLDDLIAETPHYYVMYSRGLERLFARKAAKTARVFRHVEVTVLVGSTGSGKTRRATRGPSWYIMPIGDALWFDGYQGESTLVLDDFYGTIKYSYLLRILDGHCLPIPIKGGFLYAAWTKVIITSNVGPANWYKQGYTPALRRRITRVFYLGSVDSVLRQAALPLRPRISYT